MYVVVVCLLLHPTRSKEDPVLVPYRQYMDILSEEWGEQEMPGSWGERVIQRAVLDLHNPATKRRMPKDGFIRNNRGPCVVGKISTRASLLYFWQNREKTQFVWRETTKQEIGVQLSDFQVPAHSFPARKMLIVWKKVARVSVSECIQSIPPAFPHDEVAE